MYTVDRQIPNISIATAICFTATDAFSDNLDKADQQLPPPHLSPQCSRMVKRCLECLDLKSCAGVTLAADRVMSSQFH